MDNHIEVREEGVAVIFFEGEIKGIVYNDQKTKAKRLFNLVEMGVEEISELVQGKLYTGKIKNIVDEEKE